MYPEANVTLPHSTTDSSSSILPSETTSKKIAYGINRSDKENIPQPFSFNYISALEEGYNHLWVSIILCQKCRVSMINQLSNGTKIDLKLNLYILPWFIDKLKDRVEHHFSTQCPCRDTLLFTRAFRAYKGNVFDINKEPSCKDKYTVMSTFYMTNSERIKLLKREKNFNSIT